MEPKDLKEFGVFMSLLQETFSQDKPISDKKTEIYFEILSDIPMENMELGFKDLMNKKKYPIFPLPSEIRKAAGFDDEEDIDVKALEAFREACDFVFALELPENKSGHKDPLIQETIRLCFGGWEFFAETDPRNETWDRKQFLEVYKKLFQSDQRDSLLSAAKLMKELKQNREDMKTLDEKK